MHDGSYFDNFSSNSSQEQTKQRIDIDKIIVEDADEHQEESKKQVELAEEFLDSDSNSRPSDRSRSQIGAPMISVEPFEGEF